MMPGENHSKAAGIAAEAAGSCHNCTSLQQSLNEYVAALIALKQRIIDSDHLLAEYQQKCDDLQDAERENKTLRCQLEQMSQRTSPWEQKEHQLNSLRVELEEKTSTVDVVQQSQLEDSRVKDECKKCDMAKKKHEAKLKKIEAVTSKHIKNVKQLQQEKRTIEREFKKMQKKLGDVQHKKTMKNAQTQIANDHPVLKLDKKKIRILLEELWSCIESSTENSDGDKLMLETNVKKEKNFKKLDEYTLSAGNPSTLSCNFKTSESAVVYTSNYSTNCKKSNEIHTYKDALEEHTGDKPFHTETSSADMIIFQDLNDSHLMKPDHKSDMEELLQIMNWAKPLPHLLSPLSFSPLTSKYVFGEFTDSSDNEASDGRDEFVGNKAVSCTALENELTCLQDQTNISSCPETGNFTENYKQNIGFERSEKSDTVSVVTDCMKSQSEFCSNYKGDLTTITEIGTDKKDKEITPIQTEVSFAVANALTANVLSEQNPADKENTVLSAINRANSFEESSVWYPNLNVPVRKISSINNSNVELLNPSSIDTVGDMTSPLEQPVHAADFSERLVTKNMQCSKEDGLSSARCNLPIHRKPSVNASKTLISKDSTLPNCNLEEMCSNDCESAKCAEENPVHDSITSAEENPVCGNLTGAEENPVHSTITTAGEKQVHYIITSAGENPVCGNFTGAEENPVHRSITSAEENPVHSNITSAGEKQVHDIITSAGENHVHDLTSAGENHVNDNITSAAENDVHKNITSAGEKHVHNVIFSSTGHRTSTGDNHVHGKITSAGENHVNDNITSAAGNHFHDHISSGENNVHHTITSAGQTHVHANITSAGETHIHNNITSAIEKHIHNIITSAEENHVNDNITSAAENHVQDNITSAGEKHVHDIITNSGETHVNNNITSAAGNRDHDNIISSGENNVHDTITCTGETHVHDNITGAGEYHVHNLNVEKNMHYSNLTNIDRGQDNLLFTTQPEMCLIEFNHKFNYDSKQSKSFEDVETRESYNSTLVNVEMHFAAETVPLSLNDPEEKIGHLSSSPIVQFEHTKIINHYTDKMDKLDPNYIQELSVQKESMSLEKTLSVRSDAEDGHCCKTKSNELGYGMQNSFTIVPASTDNTFQRAKVSTKTSLQLDSSTADKENNLSQSFVGKDSICLSMETLEDESREEMHSDFQTYTIKMEKSKESNHDTNELDSKISVTEKCKISSSETDQLCSSNSNLYTLVSSKAQKEVVTDIQPVIENQQDICSQSESVDDQLCSARRDQSLSTVLLHKNNTFHISNSDITNADGFLNKLEGKHVLSANGIPLQSNQQCINVSVDLVPESTDQHDKDLCKGVTPEKEFHVELDSALEKSNLDTLQSNDTLPIKFNKPKIIPLEDQKHPNVPSDLSKVLNKITDDSSEEDDFLIRKVSYTKAVSRNAVNLKGYCKSASESIEKVGSVHLVLNDTPSQPVVTHLADMVCASDVSACGASEKTENGILMEHNSLVTVDIIANSENGKKDANNTVDHHFGEIEETPTLEECEKPVSENIQYSYTNTGQNCCNTIENEARKTLPGKNLIWNFERPDDSVDPRVISGKHKLKANVKMLHGGSENLFQRTEKRPKLKGSHKVKYTDLICQAVSKENHQQKLSQGEQSLHNILVGETVLANADTSTSSDHSPETITKVRSEMGPPLPPLLGPLLATPPKSIHPLSPILSSSSCSSLPSPPDDLISPLPGTPFPRLVSPLADRRRQKSPVFATPSPAEKANSRILASPLQFCAATPKHALPVPGRLPLSASSNSSSCAQENSVKILDTMYPELSARARTLNILKGHVQLNRGLPTGGKNVSVSQITGFKPITSTSTAFIKTGGNSKADNSKDKLISYESQQQASSIASLCKRTSDAFLMPRSAKRLRLDTESPVIETMKNCSVAPTKNDTEVQHKPACNNISYCELLPDVVKNSSVDEDIITKALKKIEDLCFDLLPVIRSHIFVGTIPKVPVMRNEEKEVICEFSNSKKSLADRFLQVILKKIKTGKRSMSTAYLQALCRVYVGLCRQLGDIERARILCYSILKEDFPDPDRLLLFIVSSWNDIISTHGVVSKAIQAVLKNLAKDDVGSCLSAYLNWEKTSPMNVNLLLSSVLMAVQLCPDGKFQQSEKYGEDLTDSIWEYVFAVDLLCSHRKWVWTHDKIISKELWPLLDKWVKRKKGNPNVSFVPDIIAATVLRLVGYLCHMGLKEGFDTAVKNIGAVIIAFLQHANEEGMCWGVQLACVYMLFDLAPSNPAAIYKTLQEWKVSAKNDIPPAVASCMQELESMCGSASDLT